MWASIGDSLVVLLYPHFNNVSCARLYRMAGVEILSLHFNYRYLGNYSLINYLYFKIALLII